MPEAGAPPVDPQAAAPMERQTTPFLVLQFFIFPMAIVAVCVTVFVVFGLIAAERKGAADYLVEVRNGGANTRWQAAYELSKVLQDGKSKAFSDPKFVAQAIALFDESATDDPRVRRYMALALGRLADRRAVPSLLRVVQGTDADVETQIYAVWALGAIADPSALPDLMRLSRSEDRDLRKTAVHALGAFSEEEARETLLRSLSDSAEDVRWNAALALGRRGDPRATRILSQMMDRAHLAKVEGLKPDQREDAILQAVMASASISDPSLQLTLERLRDTDPNLKVRDAARASLDAKRP